MACQLQKASLDNVSHFAVAVFQIIDFLMWGKRLKNCNKYRYDWMFQDCLNPN